MSEQLHQRAESRHVVGSIEDFPAGTHRVVEVGDRQIGIFNIAGTLYGLPNICPHQTGPVCAGRLLTGTFRQDASTGFARSWIHDGEVIICPWHGLEYHVPTGQCLALPEIRLRRYEVIIENDQVIVLLRARTRKA